MNYKDLYPRVLVICNNSFSSSDSNGRTLKNYFIGWPKEKLAQFCIMTDGPAFDVCDNYYCVSDTSILNRILKTKMVQRDDLTKWKPESSSKKVAKKNTLTVILRHIAWKIANWNNQELRDWIDDFSPEVILFMSGDAIFMSRFARKLSISRHIPLVVYNSEGYYFFKHSYFRHKFGLDFVLFPIFQLFYRHSFEKLMGQSSLCIYLNSLLNTDYDKSFPKTNSCVLYSSSNLIIPHKEIDSKTPVFSYTGNLGLGRADALIKFGSIINKIDESYKLDVYGRPQTIEMEMKLKSSVGLSFRGVISYKEVLNVMTDSDVLVHVESFDPQWSESNRYGFSTKIPDSLMSGRPFVIFSPCNVACYGYINANKVGWCAHDETSLISAINIILRCRDERQNVLENASVVCLSNHNLETNAEKMRALLFDCVNGI